MGMPLSQTSACAPAAPRDPGWQGIVIEAPPLVRTKPGQAAVVWVCGLAVMPIIVPTPPEMRLVAVDSTTGQRYAGPVPAPAPQDNEIPNPMQRPPRQPHEVSGMTGQVRFDLDLMAVLRLPQRNADYRVHVERGALSSNVVLVQVRIAG
jgi:hypothetical protein